MREFDVMLENEEIGERNFEVKVKNGVDENNCLDFEIEVEDLNFGNIVYSEKFDNIGDCLIEVEEVVSELWEKYMVNNSCENDIKVSMNVSVMGIIK